MSADDFCEILLLIFTTEILKEQICFFEIGPFVYMHQDNMQHTYITSEISLFACMQYGDIFLLLNTNTLFKK